MGPTLGGVVVDVDVVVVVERTKTLRCPKMKANIGISMVLFGLGLEKMQIMTIHSL